MRNFVHDMLHNSPAAQRIEELWQASRIPRIIIRIWSRS